MHFKLKMMAALACFAGCVASAQDFSLHNGDRVLFYGDSITDQRLYTRDVEMYTRTRFPDLDVLFTNSGVGGDSVVGGARGTITPRLERDVFPFKPTVITVMLGMNDGHYHEFDPSVELAYETGYRYILDAFQKQLPEAKVFLIQPSPYDDITRPPMFQGGYNAVLLKMSDADAKFADERKLGLADFNTAVNATLTKANQANAGLAQTLIVDRVHPGPQVHWIMADALLKAMHASPIISKVALQFGQKTAATQTNATVTALTHATGSMSWTETENALPLPLPVGDDPAMALVVQSSTLVADLDQETLSVSGLAVAQYALEIDGQHVGNYSASALESGINLATERTPMIEQAKVVERDVDLHQQLEVLRYSQIVRDPAAETTPAAIQTLSDAIARVQEQARKDAQPRAHRYKLTKI